MAVPRPESLLSAPQPQPQPSWQERFEARWELSRRGAPAPKDPDWGVLYALKPFQRNLLRNPNPEGVNTSEPAPSCPPKAPQMSLDLQGTFRGWQMNTELLAEGKEADFPRYSWSVKQQEVDLLTEGLWVELLDVYQPDITVMDWYENSKLAPSVYELHVWLLGSDRLMVIGEFHYVAHEGDQREADKNWHHVSHVFKHYGPGARFVRFLHKTKCVETPSSFLRTRATDSSVSVQLRD
ncbi:F-box only protein 50 [Heteronotia binoei]|uniref:F-box only protein 50 n=1 Tax=Heteronotia binoei TaxID=13085 RepID=UPI00292E6ABC|nr:F-box only protein 50 [Heteronotia binoei]